MEEEEDEEEKDEEEDEEKYEEEDEEEKMEDEAEDEGRTRGMISHREKPASEGENPNCSVTGLNSLQASLRMIGDYSRLDASPTTTHLFEGEVVCSKTIQDISLGYEEYPVCLFNPGRLSNYGSISASS